MGRQIRAKIGDELGKIKRTNSFSHRANAGKLTVGEGKCPYCHHHKTLITIFKGRKCSRCKRKFIIMGGR